MATQYGVVTAQAGDTQEPATVVTNAAAETGVTAVQQGLSGAGAAAGDPHGATSGSAVTRPDFCVAGAFATVDDATYVDADDGTIGSDERWVGGHYQAQVYQNEKQQVLGGVDEHPNLNVQSLEPVGISADVALIDQN